MQVRARILVAVLGVSTMFGGLAPSAHALFGKHGSKPPKAQRMKKNANTYDYLKAKKQKKPTGYYRSTLTGDMVYGKPKK
jgi:hypothetical protein